MTTADLGLALADAGLLQYGCFVVDGESRPFQHHLTMLASYPALLADLADALAAHVRGVDRLLCPLPSTPLAVALSLATGTPLVIGHGGGHYGARDFVGAYDIGHPAALVVHALDEAPPALVAHAGRFGLNVRAVLAVLDTGGEGLDLPGVSVVRLSAVTAELVAHNKLPAGLGRAADLWLAERSTRPRRD